MEDFYYNAKIEHITEIIKNRLYFAVIEGETTKILKNTADTFYFNIDDELIYMNYYYDFGPLNISCLYKFCCKVNNYLQHSQGLKRIVHYTTSNPNKRANAAFLMGSFGIIYLKMQSRDIYHVLLNTGGPFRNFVDASQGTSQFTIKLTDCLQAIEKAITFNFIDFNDFNVAEYDMYDKLQNGDMNWLLPRKFLAFIGPTDSELLNGHSPEFYVKYFLKNDVKAVVRLNNKVYDSSVFTQAGIEHQDLFFPDGSTPPKHILLKFLEISEQVPGAIGVHCKAGLGRTGSLIGAYIVKHYRMTARQAIAWMRICRPGSVIGQQQGWLEKIESWLWRRGSQFRLEHFGEGDKIPRHRYGIYSKEWPKEKERFIKQAQKKKAESSSYRVPKSRSTSPKMEYPTYERNLSVPKKIPRQGNFEQKQSFNGKVEDSKRISKMMQKAPDHVPVSTQNNKINSERMSFRFRNDENMNESDTNIHDVQFIKPVRRKLKKPAIVLRNIEQFGKEVRQFVEEPVEQDVMYQKQYNKLTNTSNFLTPNREVVNVRLNSAKTKPTAYIRSEETTQGDRLNQLKMQRQMETSFHDREKANNDRSKRCINNMDPEEVIVNEDVRRNKYFTHINNSEAYGRGERVPSEKKRGGENVNLSKRLNTLKGIND